MFVIESANGATRLEFQGAIPHGPRPEDPFTVRVSLQGDGVEARAQVYDHLSHRWTELFEGIARDWRGWDGTRVLETLEHQLRLSATADRAGHISLRVEIHGDLSGSRWSAADTILLEAGQLDDIAHRAKAYFG